MACTVSVGLALPVHRVTDDFGGYCGVTSPALPSTCRRRRVLAGNDTNATNGTVEPTTSVVNLNV